MKRAVLFLFLMTFIVIFVSGCGSIEADEGEVKDISYKDLIKKIDNTEEQPFYLIATDANENDFEKRGKPIYEDYLSQKKMGALYINLHNATKEEIAKIKQYSSPKNEETSGSEYNPKEDGMVIVDDGEIEKASFRLVLNDKIYSQRSDQTIREEIKENVDDVAENDYN